MNNEPITPRPSRALSELFVPDRAAEIVFWTDLASGYGRVVVDWHCGTGELALGLASNGLRVVGVDPDLEAIEIARAREASVGGELLLTWLCNEPRLVSLPGSADFAILSSSTIGTYMLAEQRTGLLKNLYHHLRPGGALGIAVPLAPTSSMIDGKFISGPLRRVPRGIFARRVSTLNYDSESSVLDGHDDVLIRLPDGEQRFEDHYSRRLYSPGEIFDLLSSAGFVSIGMWGGWDRRSLRKADGFFVVRAERPISRPVGLDTSMQRS